VRVSERRQAVPGMNLSGRECRASRVRVAEARQDAILRQCFRISGFRSGSRGRGNEPNAELAKNAEALSASAASAGPALIRLRVLRRLGAHGRCRSRGGVPMGDDGHRTGEAHVSKAVIDPAFRTHTWKVYVPATGGTQVNEIAASQSRPNDHDAPS
jgi:hypothetical protein